MPSMLIVTLVPEQTSKAVGAVKLQGSPHSTIRSELQVSTGGRVSTTRMVWLHKAVLVQLSVTRQVRVALKLFGQDPALVSVLTMLMVTFVPSQMSLANGGVNCQGKPHSTKRSAAQERFGGVVSTTVMFWLQNETLVQASVAFQVWMAVKLLPQNPTLLVTVLTNSTVTLVPSQMS